jgi:hypothetical protein
MFKTFSQSWRGHILTHTHPFTLKAPAPPAQNPHDGGRGPVGEGPKKVSNTQEGGGVLVSALVLVLVSECVETNV